MRKYRLAVIGANEPLLPFFRQLDKNRFEVYGFAWADGAVCADYCDKFYPISFAEKEKILAICKELKIDGITSFSLESAVPTVIYIASEMGLPTNNKTVLQWVGKKHIMRQMLSDAQIGYSPKSYIFDHGCDIDKYSLEYPLVVKPADGGG